MKKIGSALLLAFAAPLAAQMQGSQGMSPPDPAQMSQRFIQQFDADKDGKVSLKEFSRPTEQQFQYIDKNNDNYISREEVEAFGQEMQKRMEQMRQQQQQQGGQDQAPQGQYRQQQEQQGGYGQYPQR